MKFFNITGLAILLSTAALDAAAQSFSDIYGRSLVGDRGTVVINADGSMTGVFDGQQLTGRWWTDAGNFCREGSLGGTAFGPACQTIRMGNGQISFTNVDGPRTTTYRIQ